ncbi:hypothetical protein [Yersinia pestis]|uniref:Uncharacterized protein n=2 Tax=Yersinia pestis TaxID=632 RepID=Q8CLL7_YERPE|nr:hypothetical protein [Yersinia pestis]AAM84634.1 hypothetical [Yersinia pestis KIM10+]BCU91651.1 hypothetical protein YP72344_31460 [Yersinia pseudotuberculosis]MBD3442429.1 hypothetical protein [Yersinia pestis]MBD3450487.1 hypothetical protein [Yersinia pestis]MBV7952253.1 hypothetical protein [Yersinia pestis]
MGTSTFIPDAKADIPNTKVEENNNKTIITRVNIVWRQNRNGSNNAIRALDDTNNDKEGEESRVLNLLLIFELHLNREAEILSR